MSLVYCEANYVVTDLFSLSNKRSMREILAQ
jgi:hypothetical protein